MRKALSLVLALAFLAALAFPTIAVAAQNGDCIQGQIQLQLKDGSCLD